MTSNDAFAHPWRLLAIGAVLVASYTPLQAQTADPLTGRWSGYIGRSAATPSAATFQLKLAANGSVSGSVTGPQITPGEITNGTFDARTGALKFTVLVTAAKGDSRGNVAFDGRVVRDTASGTIVLGGEKGVFRITKGGAAPPAPVPARPVGDAGEAARRGFTEVSDWITRAANLVPAERYSYRPVSTVRTYGQIIGHIADGARYYCAKAAGRTVQWSDATEKGPATKAALVQALTRALGECGPAYGGASEIGPLMENVAHSSLHYGNLVTYIRMMGMVPPSS
jgi:DinB family protein